jgi:hypothetical protein
MPIFKSIIPKIQQMRFSTILFVFLTIFQTAKAQSWTPYLSIDWLKFYHAVSDIEQDFNHQRYTQHFSAPDDPTLKRSDPLLDYQKAQLIIPEIAIGLAYDKQYMISLKSFYAVDGAPNQNALDSKRAASYFGVMLKQQLYFAPTEDKKPLIRAFMYHQIGYNWVKRNEPTYTIRGNNGRLLEIGLGATIFNYVSAYIGLAHWNRTRAQWNPATSQPEFISFPTQNIAWGLSYQFFIPIKIKKQ